MSVSQFQLSNELSPIILQGGLAEELADGVMPITAITEGTGAPLRYEDYFAHFHNLPNGTLSEWQIAQYPFASLVMAANAVIQMPLKISMIMKCPAQNNPQNNYFAKGSILTILKNQIETHVLMGGTFIVVTPAFTYTDVLLRQIRDVSPPSDKQVQTMWQWDFEQPLLSDEGAQRVLGNMLGKAEAGLPTPTTWNTQP
jgi:hypothetical protein